MDLADLLAALDATTPEERAQIRERLDAVEARHYAETLLPMVIQNQIEEYQAKTGLGTGEEWVQPTGAHNAYGMGALVTWAGKEWISTMVGNHTTPGEGYWTEKVPEGEYPTWVQPLGAGSGYLAGAIVFWKDQLWTSVHDGENVWEPGVYGWEPYEEEG